MTAISGGERPRRTHRRGETVGPPAAISETINGKLPAFWGICSGGGDRHRYSMIFIDIQDYSIDMDDRQFERFISRMTRWAVLLRPLEMVLDCDTLWPTPTCAKTVIVLWGRFCPLPATASNSVFFVHQRTSCILCLMFFCCRTSNGFAKGCVPWADVPCKKGLISWEPKQMDNKPAKSCKIMDTSAKNIYNMGDVLSPYWIPRGQRIEPAGTLRKDPLRRAAQHVGREDLMRPAWKERIHNGSARLIMIGGFHQWGYPNSWMVYKDL